MDLANRTIFQKLLENSLILFQSQGWKVSESMIGSEWHSPPINPSAPSIHCLSFLQDLSDSGTVGAWRSL